ncbi:tyrosine-protein phosphatase [Brevibacillus sp. NRS-1366]|uniref:tyrosine-protein phosphatase n=1 Tax=Brevibacillus sp. NRS-1366 TaxID=3233899 RepID=UPI003D23AC68
MRKRQWKSVSIMLLTSLTMLFSGCAGQQASSSTTQVEGEGLSIDAAVERLEINQLEISWKADDKLGEIKIYWSNSPENIEQEGKLLTTISSGSTITVDDPSPNARPYFRIIANDGLATTIAERRVPLRGAYNFRDLGGYRTEDGRAVKWGQLFRSEALNTITDEDISYLQNSGLKLVCDYRTDYEVQPKPDRAIEGVRNDNIPVFKEVPKELDTAPIFESGNLGPLGKPGEYMKIVNIAYVTNNDAFSKLLELAQMPENLPLVQHCTAGKDRTGFGSAMILLALGVPEKTVLADYMLSKTYAKEVNEKLIASIKPKMKDQNSLDIAAAIFDVREEYLQAALDEIKLKYGSIPQYLEQELGLTKEKQKKLQDLLLE